MSFPVGPDQPREAGRRFGLPGALTATTAITLLVFALVPRTRRRVGSPGILASATAGLVLLGVLIVIERRSPDPLVPPVLVATRHTLLAGQNGVVAVSRVGAGGRPSPGRWRLITLGPAGRNLQPDAQEDESNTEDAPRDQDYQVVVVHPRGP